VAVEAEREHVRGTGGIVVVLGQLEAGDDEEPVFGGSTLGLCADRVEGRRPSPGVDRGRRGVAQRDRVIRDAEDVEAGLAVRVDEVAGRQVAVAPRRVRVELAEEKAVF
jgi:hypothetical protein